MQDLLDILRLQRHDFMNHLQVISGLLQLKQPERALAYINETAEKLKKASVISRISMAEIAMAIIRADLAAHKLGLSLKCSISSNLDRGFRHTLVLAELIEEFLEFAIGEVDAAACGSGALDLNIYEKDGEYVFQVSFPCQNSLDCVSFASKIVFIKDSAAKINGQVNIGNFDGGAAVISLAVPAGTLDNEQDERE
ncbi:MAG: Spo0B domain-containing protein [Thermincola sp.]|nr:Spo0B domain-containing protein [Thermincola sp.]MDT3704349.1 Spo0B domain-containing protein [Thermincola sp.]